MTVRLDGKVVLVTGASSGIGSGVARIMAERGARVACISRRAEQAQAVGEVITALGGEFLYIQGDVASRRDCDAAVETTLERFGRLDILINNAANPIPSERVEDISDDGWRAVMGPTLDGVMHMSRAALRPMKQQDEGVIITLSSIAGDQALAHNAAYGAAKAAAVQMMKVIAVENFGSGIRANSVIIGAAYPSEMAGPQMLAMGRTLRGPDWVPDPNYGSGTLGKAVISPEAIGRAIAVLCCDDAREINGASIAMDRGFSAGLLTSTALYLGAAQLLPG